MKRLLLVAPLCALTACVPVEPPAPEATAPEAVPAPSAIDTPAPAGEAPKSPAPKAGWKSASR